MKSFADVYGECLVVGDPARTAKAIMKAVGLSAGQAVVLHQPVLLMCESRERDRARACEVAAFAAPEGTGRSGRPVGAPEKDLLRGLTFTRSDGERVPWLTATVADHLDRIELQQRLLVGIQADIDRHRAAIAAIEAAGVTCLADLDLAAAS